MDDHKKWSFISAYVWQQQAKNDWQWDNLDTTGWTNTQESALLCALPFEKNTWNRATYLLGDDEGEYWRNTSANAYLSDTPIDYVLEKLLEFGRPNAVLHALIRRLLQDQKIDPELGCNALLALVESDEPPEQIDDYV